MNRQHNEDREESRNFSAEYAKDRKEFKNFKKTYEIDREERNRTDNTELRTNLSLAQEVSNLTRDIRELQKNRVAVKQDVPQTSTDIQQNYPINQHETIIRLDSPFLEDVASDPTRSRQLTLCDIISPSQYLMDIIYLSQFVNEYREVQNAVSPR
ncbi:hypothetical protein HN011_011446 [Eciton burchellii]|nr:hypothetical protein HN011_011446 [Eciton burchellii]